MARCRCARALLRPFCAPLGKLSQLVLSRPKSPQIGAGARINDGCPSGPAAGAAADPLGGGSPLGQKSGRVYKALPGPLRARAGADPLGPGDYTLIALARSVSPLTSRRWPAAGLRHAPPGVGPLTRGGSRLFCRPFPPLLILSRATPNGPGGVSCQGAQLLGPVPLFVYPFTRA